MDILVTGGAGFVGSHLCERLVAEGHVVTSLDNYFTGTPDNHVPDVKYVAGSTEKIIDLFYNKKFDMVYHLGEYSRVEQSFDELSLVWKFNKLGTYEVMKFVKLCGAKLIYAGSSTKFAEVDDVSPYQWSKASNTEFVKLFCEWNNLDYAITYFYNVYSGREIKKGKYATVIAKFIEQIRNNEKIVITKPGTQQRNFTHVDDIVDALILIGQKGHGDEYGIGSPEAFTIIDVANILGVEYTLGPERKGNRLSAPLITDKTYELGWQPKRRLKNYLEEQKLVIESNRSI